jgi:putative two-component system response regulator
MKQLENSGAFTIPSPSQPLYHPVVLIVDDEPNVLKSLKRTLRSEAIEVLTAASGKEGLKALKNRDISVIISDIHMPEMDGITFLEIVRQAAPDITRILLTGSASIETAVNAIHRSKISEYLTKPWDDRHLVSIIKRSIHRNHLVRENKRLQNITQQQNSQLQKLNGSLEKQIRKRTHQLEEAVNEGIMMLALAAEAKDDTTGCHIKRIQFLTYSICLELGIDQTKAEEIAKASILHDVGKIHVPDHILKKCGKLTKEEKEIMQQHTIAGERILGKSNFYSVARRIARSHHERLDGSGYPDGTQGEGIPLPARIVSAADVFDALTSERPYKNAWEKADALKWMHDHSGIHFDPNVLDAMTHVLQRTDCSRIHCEENEIIGDIGNFRFCINE